MSNRTLIILSVVAVSMVCWAVIQAHLSGGYDETVQPMPLLQGLDPATVGRITLTGDGQTITLQRRGEGFVVTNKEDYPADIGRINELIRDCMGIRVTHVVSDDSDYYAEFGVTEDTAETIVKFFDGDGKLLAGLILGKDADDAGVYVRAADEDTVYIVEQPPTLDTAAMDYVDETLIDVPLEKVASVAIRGGDPDYTLSVSDDETVALAEMPDGRELDEYAAKSVVRAFDGLRFTDVRRAGEDDPTLTFDRSAVCQRNDGLVYTVQLARTGEQDDDGAWTARASAEFTGDLPEPVGRDEDDEAVAAKARALEAYDAAKAFNARHAGWLYTLSDGQAEQLTKPHDELLREPEPTTQDANGAATGAN